MLHQLLDNTVPFVETYFDDDLKGLCDERNIIDFGDPITDHQLVLLFAEWYRSDPKSLLRVRNVRDRDVLSMGRDM